MQTRKQKMDRLKSLTNQTLREITETKEDFKKYLDFSARLYKYKFEEALLIYGQNPNAMAYATLNQWNKVGRRVHKGTQSTHVFADENKSQIKYLFELSETYGRTFTNPIITKIPNHSENKILDFFGTERISDDFNKNFKWCIENYVDEHYSDFINDFTKANNKIINGKENLLTAEDFKRTVTDCVGYTLCERFSIPKGIYNSDEHAFIQLDKFNTKELMVLLGCATQFISRATIEATNTILKENENERKQAKQNTVNSRENGISEVQPYGGGSYGTGEIRTAETRSDRQMGSDISGLHGGKPPSPQDLSSNGGRVDGNGRESAGGSTRYDRNTENTVFEQEPTTERGIHEDTSIRAGNAELGGRYSVEGDSLQDEVEENLINVDEEPLNNQGSFSMEQNEVSEKIEQEKNVSPPPIFFENFNEIRDSLDYSQYNDGDVIGYDKNGVKYSVNFRDNHTFINTLTAMTPWGEILGSNEIPNDILEQIRNYKNGIQTDNTEQIQLNNIEERTEQFWQEIMEEPRLEEENSRKKISEITEPIVQNTTLSNFMITSENDIGLSSGKTKYQENVTAIKLLKEIEVENRFATAEEQKVLAKYSGFGGIPQAFDEQNSQWTNEYVELKELLSDKDYELARASTLNAHYTSTEVISAMYDGLKRLGIEGGNILEPSMGVGNFFGKLPYDFKDKSRLYGVELDETTGKIAKQLYPKANIQINGFENAKLQDNFFDVAVGNVPFGNYKVFDTKFNKRNFLIHDYFLAKTLDKVKPDGVIAFITSKGTMDKANSNVRKYLAERAELLGAIRLPNNAFKQSAGTEVTTDILFLKKRDKLIDATEENWIYTGFHDTGRKNEHGENEVVPLNQYFIDNPHMMMGEMRFDNSMYGNDKETALFPFTKKDTEQSIEEKLAVRFLMLRQSNPFNNEQLDWLDKIEKSAVAKGELNAELFLEEPYFNSFGYGAWQSLSEIFDGKLGEIIRTVNADEVDKSIIPLGDLLQGAIKNLPENIISNIVSLDELEDIKETPTLPADPTVKNFCYKFIDDKIYQRENSLMIEQELPKATLERMKMLIELRDTTKNILDIQLENCSDEDLQKEQGKLDGLYEKFTKKYGVINSKYNTRLFGEDAEFPLLSSIEEIKDDQTVIKADIFTKRTILPVKKVESVETSIEALAVSLNERGFIDINFMSNLSSKTNEEVIEELQGIIFKNPLKDNLNGRFDILNNWETSDEYLSGDVAEKLELAKGFVKDNEIYNANVTALEQVQPEPLQAHEISVKLGSSWINTEYYRQFIFETLNPKDYEKNGIDVKYYNKTNNWHIEKPYSRHSSVEATQVFGTKRMDAYQLMETMLNQKSPKIYDTVEVDGSEKRVLNKAETIAIKDKYSSLNETFKRWIFQDPTRREILVEKYNKMFNNERVRQYDGSFLHFDGMNPFIKLRQHQKNAVARILLGGNTLLAHVVGSGKTYTMVAAAMEMKRLGLSNKPCFVVPNHLVGQWSNEFKRLYPNANILSATKKDFEKKKRQRFCARIATGEWDAIIIGHSSFEKIPISSERQEQKLRQDINIAKDGLREAQKDKSERFLIKEIERTVKNLEFKLKTLTATSKDNVINFENLGIDSMFIDEAHSYKNRFMFTKMGNIAGLSKAHSKKSYDMELKCDYINEVNGAERGVTFATGTPLSNSVVELFTMQSYLQKKSLEKRGLEYFDNWASNFGERVTALELDPSGQGFRMRERFAKFTNLPELMNLYRMVADIQTADMLKLPVPEIATGKPITISVDPSPSQRALVQALLELSSSISKGDITPEIYNMLCVTNDGRLGALDMRSVDVEKFHELLGYKIDDLVQDDYEFSKVNACVNKVFDIYKETKADSSTQMIFSDISTPKGGKQFSVYDDIKEKLINKGVAENEIYFIHDAKTDEEKEKVFSKMRSGEIRVLLGSTQKMGAGTNAQKKLIALHHMDCPYRPSDLSQREGRIVRQGNDNPVVQIYQYVTKNSFDAYLWQIVETKQKFISQVMSGKTPTRTMEDVDATALNYAEVKAIATGNPAIKRKMELEIEQSRLKVLEQQYYQSKYNLEDNIIKKYPTQIATTTTLIKALEQDISLRDKNVTAEFSIKLGKNIFTERKEAGELLVKAVQSQQYTNKEIGEYKGFKVIPMAKDVFSEYHKVMLKGATNHVVDISMSDIGSITRIENSISNIEEKLQSARDNLQTTTGQLETSKVQLAKPFEHMEELNTVLGELTEINNSLDIGKEENTAVIDENESNLAKEFVVVEETEFEMEEDLEL